MHKEKSSVTLDEHSSEDNIMEVEKEIAENSNTNQDETDIDSEFNSEASINDTVSENFHITFVQIAFIWEAAVLFANCNIEKKTPNQKF